jgi:hemerythrin-like domain-containing protein
MKQCGLFGEDINDKKELCAALKLLKDEHVPLNQMKSKMNNLALKFSVDTRPEQYTEALLILRKDVQSFLGVLKPHSEKEEGVLFPLMQKYIGKGAGPLVVMEYEHDEAKRNIESFLDQTSSLPDRMSEEEFNHLLHFVMETYDILTAHFMKEEMILFPMAEEYLSEEEKQELLHKIQLSC